MIDLYLIRHAECEMNKKRHLIGGISNDSPLSQKGISQARLLGERLKSTGIQFDKVYSSPAERAYRTAKIACEVIGHPLDEIILSDELLELSQGDWEGALRDEVYTDEVIAKMISDNWNFAAPNGESQRTVEERMISWIQENVLPSYGEGLVAGVFTHGLAIKCSLRGILDFDPKNTYKIALKNTSITRLKYRENGWNLISVNDAGHLIGKIK